MRATSVSYSETEVHPDLQFLKSPTTTTANSGIQRESLDGASLSMTELGVGNILIYYLADSLEQDHLNLDKLWWRRGPEWTGLYAVLRLPENIREKLGNLNGVLTEDTLYETADQIASWIEDASIAEQNTFATHINELSVKGARILLSAFADAEVQLASEQLLHTITGFLHSDDKRLSQTAAVCLLRCGGKPGKTLLSAQLWNPASLPHMQLILGAIKLFASP